MNLQPFFGVDSLLARSRASIRELGPRATSEIWANT